ncbi:MAG: GspE/PulE family protein [Patescibacteria group bacterium]|nr:GspE/PulE family protein [Patescibacteria group bacterium]
MPVETGKLIAALVERKLITAEQATKLGAKGAEDPVGVESAMLKEGWVDEETLTKVKGEMLGVPYIDLAGRTIPPAVLNTLPPTVAENYQMVAFERRGNEIKVALVDPQNFKAIEAVDFLAQEGSLTVRYYIVSASGLRQVSRQYGELNKEAEEALAGVTEKEVDEELRVMPKDLQEVVRSAPVSKMVLVIIRHAIDGRASDIHIEPEPHETRVRYRIDGMLRTSLHLPRYIHSAIVARIKVLANLRLDETRKPQDGRIRLTIEGRDVDFRVSTLPLFEGEKVVMRVLDASFKVPTLQDLGFSEPHIAAIVASIAKPHGLLLLTGPTGSGKTTTLYTVLTLLNKEGVNIITLEDPVEYSVEGINQSQINPDVGYSFASGLRSILRQDPNIIMLGEIRDQESAELVTHASLTGHLVLSTLHTNDAIGAVPRLLDMGVEPFLLSSTVNAVVAQRLARRICEHCREPLKMPAVMEKGLAAEIAAVPNKHWPTDLSREKFQFWKGKGCSRCGNTGYLGRIAVAEVVEFTPELQELITTGFRGKDVETQLGKQEYITLRQDGLVKVLQGKTTLEEIYRVTKL